MIPKLFISCLIIDLICLWICEKNSRNQRQQQRRFWLQIVEKHQSFQCGQIDTRSKQVLFLRIIMIETISVKSVCMSVNLILYLFLCPWYVTPGRGSLRNYSKIDVRDSCWAQRDKGLSTSRAERFHHSNVPLYVLLH